MRGRAYAEKIVAGIAALVLLTAAVVHIAPHLGVWLNDIGSGSMTPALPVGTLVIASRADPVALQTGDIIVYQPATRSNYFVCHRIVEIIPGNPVSFVTRGDNNPDPDPVAVAAANVMGKVRWHIAGLGNYVQFLKTVPGLCTGLGLPAIILVLFLSRSVYREIRTSAGIKKSVKLIL